MKKQKKQYLFEGAVMHFDTCVCDKVQIVTFAVSEKQAKSNVAFQMKKKLGFAPATVINLRGKVTELC